MKHPPKYIKQTATCCGNKIEWVDCCRPGPDGCPDCGGAGGWWDDCPTCHNQPDLEDAPRKRKRK